MRTGLPAAIRESRTLQVLLAAFATIFLGAIGSGLWELVLARMLQAIANGFLAAMSHLFHGYVEILHRNVGKGPSGQLEILPYVVAVTVLIVGPWAMVFGVMSATRRLRRRVLRAANNQAEQIAPKMRLAEVERTRKRVIRLLIPTAGITSLVYLQDVIETGYTIRAARFLDRSIEIVAPVVDHHTVLRLRASYRAIDNAKKFYVLEDEIRAIARDKRLTLPDFKSIR